MLYITLPPFPKLIFMIVCLDCFKLYLKIDEAGESLRLSGIAVHAMADLWTKDLRPNSVSGLVSTTFKDFLRLWWDPTRSKQLCFSKSIIVGSKLTVFALFYFVWGKFSKYKLPRGGAGGRGGGVCLYLKGPAINRVFFFAFSDVVIFARTTVTK